MEIIVTTFAGFEPLLAAEIEALGARGIRVLNRAVSFDGNKRLLYQSNMHLRTALRVLTPLRKGVVRNERELYNFVKQEIQWHNFMDTWDKFIIDPVVWSQEFPHSLYVAQKVKDAIVDQFRERTRKRPTVSGHRPKLHINVHIVDDRITVSLDSSDQPLFKRGYRVQGHEAPLNEASAAAILMLSGWDRKSTILDPMCGSGTLPIEAALMATRRAPGLSREEFGFMRWSNFEKPLWDEIVEDAKKLIIEAPCKFFGYDLSPVNVRKAQENVAAAGLSDIVEIGRKKFDRLKPPVSEPGWIISNPPYDERLAIEDIQAFYRMIGETVRDGFPGWKSWFLTSNAEALNATGRKGREFDVKNGALDCVFREVFPESPFEPEN